MSENQDYEVQQTAKARAAVSDTPTGDLETKTAYDRLQEMFEKEVESDPITLDIPKRPGMAIRFDTNIDSAELDLWRKQSAPGGNRGQRRGNDTGEVDGMKMSALCVFNKAEAFLVDGEDVVIPGTDGQTLTFHDQTILKKILGITAATNTELVRKVFANDAHVMAAGGQVMEAAGYGDELPEASSPN